MFVVHMRRGAVAIATQQRVVSTVRSNSITSMHSHVGTGYARRSLLKTPTFHARCKRTVVSSSISKAPNNSSGSGKKENSFFKEHGFSFVRSVATIGVSLGVGDAVCQLLESGGNTDMVSPERVRKMMFIGTFITGPVSHSWMILVEHLFPGKTMPAALLKTFATCVYAFFINIPLTFTAVTMIPTGHKDEPKKGIEDVVAKVKRDLVPTFATGSLYWPFLNILIFKMVPVNYRAIAGSLVGVIWNVYLSSVANSSNAADNDSALVTTNEQDENEKIETANSSIETVVK